MMSAAGTPPGGEPPAGTDAGDDRLARVAAHEASLRPALLTRLMRSLGRSPAFAWFYRRIGPRLDTWLNRRFPGVARLYGFTALILVTTGARTGLPRPTPLLYVRDGDDFLVVGTNFGQAHHPAWTGNLLAQPAATIDVAGLSLAVVASLVDDVQFAAHWPRFVAVYPGYAGYLARSGRKPRMFRLAPLPAA